MRKWIGAFLLTGMLLFVFMPAGPSCASAKKTLRVGFNFHMQPFQFLLSNGSYGGMHIEIMNWIGMNQNLTLIYVPLDTDSECAAALENNEVDVLLGCRTGDKLMENFEYAIELSAASLCMIAPKQIAKTLVSRSDYAKHTVALEYNSIGYSDLTRMGVRSYRPYGDQERLCGALLSGREKIAVGVEESISYMLTKAGLQNEFTIVHRYMSPIRFAAYVSKGNWEATEALKQGMTELRAVGEYEEIYGNWIINSDIMKTRQRVKFFSITSLCILAGVLIIFLSNLRTNRLLKTKVAEKTSELFMTNKELEHRMSMLQTEGQLRNSIIENSPNGMIVVNTEGVITLANRSAQMISGMSLMGQRVAEAPVFAEIAQSSGMQSTRQGSGASNQIELGGFTNRRNYRFDIFCPEEYDTINGTLITVEDITREERKKQELFEAEKSRSLNRIVAGIAHEIKNPLMSIRTAASLLCARGDDPEVQEAFTEFVPKEVDRINRLVEGLIGYARPVKADVEMVDLSALIRECIYLIQVSTCKDSIRLDLRLEDGVFIRVSRDQLKQSVINLILNSLESIDDKLARQGRANDIVALNIANFTRGDIAFIVIQDEGMGMTPEQIQLCAEPFYTTKNGGNGLGLPLTKQFVQSCGGEMKICSEAGNGTKITLSFPIMEDK